MFDGYVAPGQAVLRLDWLCRFVLPCPRETCSSRHAAQSALSCLAELLLKVSTLLCSSPVVRRSWPIS